MSRLEPKPDSPSGSYEGTLSRFWVKTYRAFVSTGMGKGS